MPYTNTYINQVKATADSKLALRSYSGFLKRLYGMSMSTCLNIKELLLLKFTLDSWDNNPGTLNTLSETQLTKVIRTVNKL